MSYVDQNLIPGEQILYRTGLHWQYLFPAFVFGGLFILSGCLSILADSVKAGLIIAGLGFLMIYLSVISRRATEMVITDIRVIIKVGLFRIRTIEMMLSKIESIDVNQGLLGRMFGYGTIVLKGTGGSREPFKNVRSPLDFRRHVQQHSHQQLTSSRQLV